MEDKTATTGKKLSYTLTTKLQLLLYIYDW